VTNVINESARDIIVCSTICAIIVVLQYIASSIVFSQDGLGIQSMAFSGTPSATVKKLVSENGLVMGTDSYRPILWEGLHHILLLVIKVYQMRLFDVNEYEEDLCKELKRMKALRKKTAYSRDYARKLKYPEQAIMYVRIVQLVQIFYLILMLSLRCFNYLMAFTVKLRGG